MTHRLPQLLAITLCGVISTSVMAQEPELIVEVNERQVYQGESVIYSVTVNHVDNPSPPKLDGFDDFQVDLLGQQSQNSQQITIINGRRSEIIRRGMLFQYRLTPTVAGDLIIPAPTADVDGQTIQGDEIRLRVVAPQEQDFVILQLTVDRTSVYPLQPFTVTLDVAVKELPGELADRSPLSVQPNPVELTVPWLEDEQLPESLKPDKPVLNIVQPLVQRSGQSGGLHINDIGSNSGFLFARRRKAVFSPPSRRMRRTTSSGEEAGYIEYKLQRKFIPQRVGPINFSPCNIKGTFGTEIAGGRLSGEEIYAVSQSLVVTVKDVPLDGRPDSYIGAVGTFQVSSDLNPTTASVGDPLTLTVTVFGEGTLADVRPPDIESIESLSNAFKTYEATEKTVGDGRVFTYSLRALGEDVEELPAIPMAYFDVEKEAYVSLQTDPIPVSISAARKLSTSDIVSSRPAANGAVETLEVNSKGLFANHTSLQALRAERFGTSVWLSIWGAMIAGYFVCSLGLRRHQQLHSDPALLRRRAAKSRAFQTLNSACSSGEGVTSDTFSRIVAGLIADFTNSVETGMTSHDAAAALSAAGVSPEVIKRTSDFMDHCDAARFGAGEDNSHELKSECHSLLTDLSRELAKR